MIFCLIYLICPGCEKGSKADPATVVYWLTLGFYVSLWRTKRKTFTSWGSGFCFFGWDLFEPLWKWIVLTMVYTYLDL